LEKVRIPVDSEPLVLFAPPQLSEAVQVVAFLEVQLIVPALPFIIGDEPGIPLILMLTVTGLGGMPQATPFGAHLLTPAPATEVHVLD